MLTIASDVTHVSLSLTFHFYSHTLSSSFNPWVRPATFWTSAWGTHTFCLSHFGGLLIHSDPNHLCICHFPPFSPLYSFFLESVVPGPLHPTHTPFPSAFLLGVSFCLSVSHTHSHWGRDLPHSLGSLHSQPGLHMGGLSPMCNSGCLAGCPQEVQNCGFAYTKVLALREVTSTLTVPLWFSMICSRFGIVDNLTFLF